MLEQYLSNEEYPTYFSKLSNLRRRIVEDLPIESGMCILDVGTGYGFFTIELAKREPNLKIVGVDICQNDVVNARKNVEKCNLGGCIEVVEMDATAMSFPDENFDMVVNFLGLEDIHMTRGKSGVEKTFSEVNRILKPDGYFCFTVMPPEEMETEAQKIEVVLFSYICNARWLSAMEYEAMFERTKFKLIEKKNYYTGKKLTAAQARSEIRFACENVPKIYGINTRSLDEVWTQHGTEIEENGLGHYSKVVLMIAQKVS